MKATYLAAAGGLVLVGAIAACAPRVIAATGAQDYADYCAACHGASGRGDGPAGRGMTPRPSDLTLIARNQGGVFPMTSVMGHIDGYTMGRSASPMPEFAELLDGPSVMYDDGSGKRVPTPARLIALADYLRQIQR
ncbi:c-type cytochrome [Paracoccus sp. (in: a-proteobacteria)]|uniref:c-type cytochrome n=1 Tax=Paracoccus sp. TaxID=267 RepID=UPI0026E02CF8|nr:c-type cytochrome [Paracoccus sp. (in: a-proteobacteria)]MDO5647286.1 c-type cytochrome [Paracoccus sp. (in: a-proteobacteria)]